MFYTEFSTDEVRDWIDEDAEKAADLFQEREYNGTDILAGCVVDAIDDRLAYNKEALQVIAYYGTFDALIYNGGSYEDSPAAQYERDVYDRAEQLVMERRHQ